MELFTLFGKIAVNDKDANKKIDGVTSHAKNAEGKISSAFSKIGKVVAGAFTVGAVVAFEKKIVSTYSTYDDQMRKVQAVSGATGKQFMDLRAKAEELGAKTRFSATEAGEGMENLARAGWKTGEIMEGIGPVLSFATANAIDLGSAAGIVSNGLSQFGLKAKDTTMFTDVLSATAAAANTDIGLLGETFKYVGPVAGSLGYKLQDVSVAIGLMANKGIAGSQAGTSLRSAMTRLANPTGDSAKAMKQLGISLTDSTGKVKPFTILMQDLRGKFSKLSDAQKAQMASTIFGQEAMSGMLAVVNSSDAEFNKMTKAIAESDGQTQKMADTMDGGLGGALASVSSAWEGFLIKLGEMQDGILVDMLNGLASAIQGLPNEIEYVSNKIKELTNFYKEHEDIIKAVVIGIGTLVAGFAMVNAKVKIAELGLKGFMKGTKLLKGIPTLLSGISKAFTFLLSPAGMVTVAIAGFAMGAYLIYKNWDKIAPWLTNLWNTIKEVTCTVWEDIKTVITVVVMAIQMVIQTTFTLLITIIKIPLEIIKAIITTIWNYIGDYIKTIVNNIKTIIETIWNAIANVTSTVFNAIKVYFTTVWNFYKTIFTNALNAIKQVVITSWNSIKDVTSAIWNSIKEIISNVWNGIKSVIEPIINGIKNTISSVWNSIKSTTTSVWNNIKTAMTKPIEQARDKIKGILDKIKGFFSNLKLRFPKIEMPKLPHFKLNGEFSLKPPQVPKLGVEWYADGGILTKPTVFGMNGNRAMVGGEAGAEAVLPIEKLSGILADTLKDLGANRDIVIQLDGRTIARVTAPYMDTELNKRKNRGGRY